MLAAGALHATCAAETRPAYIGTWASNPSHCKFGQEHENAPMIVTAEGYDQHETHCSFSNLREKGAIWTLTAACAVEGDTQRVQLVLAVPDGRLTIRDQFGSRVLQRCR